MSGPVERSALERRWLDLVGRALPEVADERGSPVRLDHCFARILLDTVCAAPWRHRVRPPARRNLPTPLLTRAVALAEAALDGEVDITLLNRRSITMRRSGQSHDRPGPTLL